MAAKLALLESTKMADLVLKNRMVLAPLTRGRCGRSGVPNETNATYYEQRSNAGLIISEGAVPSKQAMGWVGCPGIYTPEQVAGWKVVNDRVHAAGSHIFCQLWHNGRVSSKFFYGLDPIGPSAIGAEGHCRDWEGNHVDYVVPRELTIEEIPTIVSEYKHAAQCAKDAGFDGIEIHCANGYLLNIFLESSTNHRTDAYGGSFENRYRLVKEVIEACKEVWPANRIGLRFSPNGVFNSMGSKDNNEMFDYVLAQLDPGMAYVHVMDGLAFGFHELTEAYTLDRVRGIFKGTIMGNCGYTKDMGEEAIKSGKADLIAYGRPWIYNPDLPARFENDWPLAEGGMDSWYGQVHDGAASTQQTAGYTDFPTYSP